MTEVIENPFDEGLQPERTLLAWRRTALALAIACAVGLRLTVPDFGALAVVAGVLGVVLSLVAYVGATVRYRRAHRSLVDSSTLSTGGLTMTAVAATAVVLGIAAMIWLVLR